MKIHIVRLLALFGAAFLARGLSCQGQDSKIPKVGDKAPLIEGKDQDGKAWKLTDVVGKKVVLLYFYPKDDTPGCTKEACGFRDQMGVIEKANTVVLGVSMDDGESHQKFIK